MKKATDQSEFWIWGPRTVYSSTIHKYMCPKVRLNIFFKCIFPVFNVFYYFSCIFPNVVQAEHPEEQDHCQVWTDAPPGHQLLHLDSNPGPVSSSCPIPDTPQWTLLVIFCRAGLVTDVCPLCVKIMTKVTICLP